MAESRETEEIFNSITHGRISIEESISLIKGFLEERPDDKYSLVIGTDSHERNILPRKSKSISLVTAVLVHRKGFGGKYFWKKKDLSNIHSLRQKIYAETLESLSFAAIF